MQPIWRVPKNTESNRTSAKCTKWKGNFYIQGVEVDGIKEKMRWEIKGLGIV